MTSFISLGIQDDPVHDVIHTVVKEIQQFRDTKKAFKRFIDAKIVFPEKQVREECEDAYRNYTETCKNVPIRSYTCFFENIGVFPHMNYIRNAYIRIKWSEEGFILHEYFREVFFTVNDREYGFNAGPKGKTYIVENNKEVVPRLIRETDRGCGPNQDADVRLPARDCTDSGGRHLEPGRCTL